MYRATFFFKFYFSKTCTCYSHQCTRWKQLLYTYIISKFTPQPFPWKGVAGLRFSVNGYRMLCEFFGLFIFFFFGFCFEQFFLILLKNYSFRFPDEDTWTALPSSDSGQLAAFLRMNGPGNFSTEIIPSLEPRFCDPS